MIKSEPQYVYDERGFPTLTKPWQGEVPEIPTFTETDSGKRRKGAVEVMMDYIIKEWLVDNENEAVVCSAQYLAEQCTAIDGKPTSTVSVYRVLELWEDMNYCVLARDPMAFVCFTEDGMKLGYDELHRLHKRKMRRDREARARNELSLKVRKRTK